MGKDGENSTAFVNVWDPFQQYGLALIVAWISNDMPSKGRHSSIDQFPNFNGANVEVW